MESFFLFNNDVARKTKKKSFLAGDQVGGNDTILVSRGKKNQKVDGII